MKKQLPNLDGFSQRLSKNPKSSGLRGALASVLLLLFMALGQRVLTAPLYPLDG
jgi:hypothetical protein